MTVARMAYVLLSLCCAAKSDEFAASTATCSSPDCTADDGAHALELLQKTMEVDPQPVDQSLMKVEDSSVIKDTSSKLDADMIKQIKAKDEMIEFLRTSLGYWRDRALSGGSKDGAPDLKLLQETMEVDAQQVKQDTSKLEADMIKQVKAKDEMIEFLRTSLNYWRDRALSGGSKDGAHDLKLLQKTMEVDAQQVKQDTSSKLEADMIKKIKAKDEMIEFLRTSLNYWRDRALSGGSNDGAHDLKLLQKTMEVDAQQVKQETLSKLEADLMKQMKAKDETIAFLKTSVAYWRDRAMSGSRPSPSGQ